jgi:hypothetical protein
MKVTIEIPDALLRRAKAVARREKTTLRALIEEGLRLVLKQTRTKDAGPVNESSHASDAIKADR